MANVAGKDASLQPTEASAAESLRNALVAALSEIPGIGFVFKAIGKLPARWVGNVVMFFLLFIIYPLISIFFLLIVLNLSPRSVKQVAQKFVLSSLNLDSELRRSINDSNRAIDNSVYLTFNRSNFEDQFIFTKIYQKIELSVSNKFSGAQKTDPKCAAIDSPKNLGALRVSVDDLLLVPNEYIIPLRYSEDGVQKRDNFLVDSLGDDFWGKVKEAYSSNGGMPRNVTLRFSFAESDEFARSNLAACYDYNFRLLLNIYKPEIKGESA